METRHDSRFSDRELRQPLPNLPRTTMQYYEESPHRSPEHRSVGSPDARRRVSTTAAYVEDAPAPAPRTLPRSRRESVRSNDDVVMSIAPAATPSQPRTAPGRARRTATPFVLPPLRSLADQALPSLVMVATALAIAVVGPVAVFGVPLWAFAAVVPAAAFTVLANEIAHPVWSHASLVNLAVLLAIFPILVIRQSVGRIPYIDWSSGTLAAPVMLTLALIGGLTGVALFAAYLCREDPEFAGVVFLPAAMLVPFFAGSTTITGLHSALLMVAAIYLFTAVLTVVAFVTPSGWSGLIAPVAIMIEFLVLAALRGASIFPVGSGVAMRVLFFVTVAVTVALTIVVPMVSAWMHQVMLIVRTADRRTGAARAS